MDEGVAQAGDLRVAELEAVDHGGVLQGRLSWQRAKGLGGAVHARLRRGTWGRQTPARGLVALGESVANGGGKCLHGAVQGLITPIAGRGGLWFHGEVSKGEWSACSLRSKFFLGSPALQVGSGRGTPGDMFGLSAAPDAAREGAGVEFGSVFRTGAGDREVSGCGRGRVGQDALSRGKVEALTCRAPRWRLSWAVNSRAHAHGAGGFGEGLADGRSGRLVNGSLLVELGRRANRACCIAGNWSGARRRSWAGQDGHHVALVRGGSDGETQRGKAAAPSRPGAII